jgi:hypothetical protein
LQAQPNFANHIALRDIWKSWLAFITAFMQIVEYYLLEMKQQVRFTPLALHSALQQCRCWRMGLIS